jgi:hypothetical protein
VSSGGFEIRGGGTPPPEVLAALAVALTPSSLGDDAPVRTAVPAWTAAALAEGVGARTAARPTDLTELAPGG